MDSRRSEGHCESIQHELAQFQWIQSRVEATDPDNPTGSSEIRALCQGTRWRLCFNFWKKGNRILNLSIPLSARKSWRSRLCAAFFFPLFQSSSGQAKVTPLLYCRGEGREGFCSSWDPVLSVSWGFKWDLVLFSLFAGSLFLRFLASVLVNEV